MSRPDRGLWAVADGMGGHFAGEVASALVIESLDERAPNLDATTRETALRAALDLANARLLEMAGAFGETAVIGTTVVALAADAECFFCIWAGDSRAYLARGDGLARLTTDHSLVQEMVDAGELDPSAAEAHPDAHIITEAVGSSAMLNPETIEAPIMVGDTFLLTSDGLTRIVSDAEILDSLLSGDLESEADRLLALCLDRGAPDNLTFVFVRAHAGRDAPVGESG